MAIGSGISAQLGLIEESTYGTAVTVTRFVEFLQESLKLQIDRIDSKGLRGGVRTMRKDRWVANRKGVDGSLSLEVASVGFGIWFKALMGAVTTTTDGTLGKKHAFTMGSAAPSLTVQVGRPDVTGTVNPFTYSGVVVTDGELSCDVDGLLNLNLSLDGQDEATATALATASYPTTQEILNFIGGTVTVGGSAKDVTKFSIKIDQGYIKDRFFIRGNSLKKKPIPGMASVTGTLEMEFTSLADYALFTAGGTAAFVATFAGSNYEASHPFKVVVTCPAIRFDGETPNVSDAGVVKLSLPFTALDDGTASSPCEIDYYTTDVLP